jgi:hypothetical protein
MIINNLQLSGGENLVIRLGSSSSTPNSSSVRVGWAFIYLSQRCEEVKTARAVDRLGQNFAVDFLLLPLAKPIHFMELSVWLTVFVLQSNIYFGG